MTSRSSSTYEHSYANKSAYAICGCVVIKFHFLNFILFREQDAVSKSQHAINTVVVEITSLKF